MWLVNLKIALIEKDLERLSKLMDSTPQLETKEEMQEALVLIEQAKELVFGLKEETKISMQQIQKNKNFLKSTQAPTTGKLDITS
ncbi:MAG: hypothetical protein U9O86_09210 [Campylobacterota bacterium]|nr:hypothetical protein [Campylobacterota bacterium]